MFLLIMLAGCGNDSLMQKSTAQVESIVTEKTDSLTEENNTIVEDAAETTSASSVTTEQSESDPSIQLIPIGMYTIMEVRSGKGSSAGWAG